MKIQIDHTKKSFWDCIKVNHEKMWKKLYDKISKPGFLKSELADFIQNNLSDAEILGLATEQVLSKVEAAINAASNNKDSCDCPKCNPEAAKKKLTDIIDDFIDKRY